MTNVTVIFEYEEPEYCRLCLSESSENNELSTIEDIRKANIELTDITRKVRTLLNIELNLAKDSDAFICATCVESLDEFYRYRSRCQQNNVKLNMQAIERKQKQIELAKSAIENANILEHVKDDEPIKVIIRMNTEGKASVRLQVQSKQPTDEPNTSVTAPSTSVCKQITPEAQLPTTSIAEPAPIPTKESNKLIRLPTQEFYFYQTPVIKNGLIYGGYRYCGSVPRKNRTYWVCEQRKSENCLTLLFVDKTYTNFYLNWGHNHEPPKVKSQLTIFKAKDILETVIQTEKVREQQLDQNKIQQNSGTETGKILPRTTPVLEMKIKDESSDCGEEQSCGAISRNLDCNTRDNILLGDVTIKEEPCGIEDSNTRDDVLPGDLAVKEEPDEFEDTQSSTSSTPRFKIDAGDNMYIIQELR